MLAFLHSIVKYWGEASYACPECRKPADECDTEDWGYRCPDCDIYFETPDV